MSSPSLQIAYLVRHGETAWSLTGQHTGLSDIPLTQRGEQHAQQLGTRLKSLEVARVFTSPLQRAARTCEIAGFKDRAEVDRDLVEWDYGDFEGMRLAEIRALQPHWDIFRDGCPGGESVAQVIARAQRVVDRIRAVQGNVLIFSSGHITRMLASRWTNVSPMDSARRHMLSTASLSAVGYENEITIPAIHFWNDTRHLES